MSLFGLKENEYIILKEGYNRGLIVGSIFILGVIVFFFSTKLWLPDGRDKMTLNIKDEMSFRDTIVNIDKNYYWNKDKQIAEISFTERCINVNDETIKCTVKNQDKVEMPISLIKGNAIAEEEGSIVTKTDYILQFGMPKNTYYLTFEIKKGDLKYDFSIDYRDFQNKGIVELDSQYLADVENINIEIEQLKGQKQILENELKEIEGMSEEEKKMKQVRIEELKQGIEKIENDIKADYHMIEQLNEGIE